MWHYPRLVNQSQVTGPGIGRLSSAAAAHNIGRRPTSVPEVEGVWKRVTQQLFQILKVVVSSLQSFFCYTFPSCRYTLLIYRFLLCLLQNSFSFWQVLVHLNELHTKNVGLWQSKLQFMCQW